jgi:hypothetical protein
VAKAVGGTRAYFPERPRQGSWLWAAVGREKALVVGALFASGRGGVELEVPRGPMLSRSEMWREMRRRFKAGQSKTEIALALGIHYKTVQAHRTGRRATAEMEARQLEFLDL